MPFWSKKPTVEDQVIELRMTAKTIAMQQKNAEKQAKVFENKMMAVRLKYHSLWSLGGEEGKSRYCQDVCWRMDCLMVDNV